jgi:hypothetical protein
MEVGKGGLEDLRAGWKIRDEGWMILLMRGPEAQRLS